MVALGELCSWGAQSCSGGAGGRAGVLGALGRGDLGKWFHSSTVELVLAPGAFLHVWYTKQSLLEEPECVRAPVTWSQLCYSSYFA